MNAALMLLLLKCGPGEIPQVVVAPINGKAEFSPIVKGAVEIQPIIAGKLRIEPLLTGATEAP